jgi:NAD(P)-dependent dehydrogenase (short-subunit alcohol dehydrogenase family)
MNLSKHVAIITGANRGIGEAFVHAFAESGVARIYAAVRRPESAAALTRRYGDRVSVIPLDVAKPSQIAAAAARAHDVTILVNNAGYASLGTGILATEVESNLDEEWTINVLGPLRATREFAPIIKANGGGYVINLNSVVSFRNVAFAPTYSISKSAAFSLTQALRNELAPANIKVISVHPGPIDTDMAKDVPLDKVPPSVVAGATLEAMAEGRFLVFPDPYAAQFWSELAASPKAFFSEVQAANVEAM